MIFLMFIIPAPFLLKREENAARSRYNREGAITDARLAGLLIEANEEGG
jgi:hypothetical protein